MTPEEKARTQIDRQLEACGWTVQDIRAMNISAARGVAVREFPLSTCFKASTQFKGYPDFEISHVIVDRNDHTCQTREEFASPITNEVLN